jgi:hypothetical protein
VPRSADRDRDDDIEIDELRSNSSHTPVEVEGFTEKKVVELQATSSQIYKPSNTNSEVWNYFHLRRDVPNRIFCEAKKKWRSLQTILFIH